MPFEHTDAKDFKGVSASSSSRRFTVRKEHHVPHVPCTPQISNIDYVPPMFDLVNLRERFYAGSKVSDEVLHHILHPEEDGENETDEQGHIPLDLGTKTLQRIIDQMKNIVSIPRSEPYQQEAFAAGLPRYCAYLQGERCHAPSVASLEQILAGNH